MTKGYSGWTNHATWTVNLWLTNDIKLYERAKSCKSAKEIRKLVELITETPPSLKGDLINSILQDVNWNEVYDSFNEE